ncbi:MAG: hypothetical protein DI535_22215 [Citrobacter freundii]|nr:MAG: hypothetical protein DI535_22215 [Citrobacter freundii]
MKRQYNLLLHPAFLISLFLLLLNDISLKYEFHNAFTGKLSDFCGLFALGIFWLAVLPNRKKTVLISIAIFFIWWKSPLSTTFITAWNEMMPFRIARVIDYWDLTALVVLPLAFQLAKQNSDPRIKYKRIFIPLVGCISIFAFCFTSAMRYAAYFEPPNEIRFYGSFKTHKTEEQILEKLTAKEISYQKDSVGYYKLKSAYYDNDTFVLRVGDPQADSVRWIPLSNSKDSVLYVKRKEGIFYIIPHYVLDGQELTNVKISITTGNKANTVFVQTFQRDSREEFSNKIRRKYKKHFAELFR